MSQGLRPYMPKQVFHISDLGEANIKLSPDDQDYYVYLIQPLFSFSSSFGFNLNILMKINSLGFKISLPHQCYITKDSHLNTLNLHLYDDSCIVFKKKSNTNTYKSTEGFEEIELENFKSCILNFTNKDFQTFNYNSQTNRYELSTIKLDGSNESTTTIQKENNITEVKNTLNDLFIKIIEDSNSLEVQICKNANSDNGVTTHILNKFTFIKQSDKELFIKYYDCFAGSFNALKSDMYVEEEIIIGQNFIVVYRYKGDDFNNYLFRLNNDNTISEYEEISGNKASFEYYSNNSVVDLDFALNKQYYEYYYNRKDRVTHQVDLNKKYCIFNTYNGLNLIMQQSVPIYYRDFNKNENVFCYSEYLKPVKDTLYSANYGAYGLKGEVFTACIELDGTGYNTLYVQFSYKNKAGEIKSIQDILKKNSDNYFFHIL